MTPKRIGLMAYPGVASLELSGLAQALTRVTIDQNGAGSMPGYEIMVIAESHRPFTTDSGLVMHPHAIFKNAPCLDTLIVPGGTSPRGIATTDSISDFIRERESQTRRIVSLCTGVYKVAATGLLSGRRATIHWHWIRDFAKRFPNVRLEEDNLYIKDDKYYTAAGGTAAIDVALCLIEEDYGELASLAVARDLIVDAKRTGEHQQFSERLHFQTTSTSRLSDLTTWILSHLQHNLSVEKLAAKACLCPRQFGRRFKVEVGVTPAEFVEKARIDEACRRLRTSDATIQHIAVSVGYTSSDVFRRRFEHRAGISPTEFRRRFRKRTESALRHHRVSRRDQLVAA